VLPDELEMTIQIVIRLDFDQVDLIGKVGGICSTMVDWHSGVIPAMDDDHRDRRRDGLKIAKPICVKVIPDGELSLECVVKHWHSASFFPMDKFLVREARR